MKRKIALSVLASGLLFGDVTLQLHKGWNLVGYNKTNVSDIKITSIKEKYQLSNILTYKFSKTRAGYQLLPDTSPNLLEAGVGYWIKASKDINMTIATTDTLYSPTLMAGWNLIVMNKQDKEEAISSLLKSGVKIDSVITYKWSKTRAGYQLLPDTNPSNFETTQGYWIKAEKLRGTGTTKEGYDVKLYVIQKM